MKVDVVAAPRDYGFGMTLVVSVVNASSGAAVLSLDKANFRVTVIQRPSGWSVGDNLLISSGIFAPSEGVYAFSVAENSLGSPKKLPAGAYTFAVVVQGTLGRTVVQGQTLATAIMK